MAEANIRAVITADDRASATLRGFSSEVENLGSKLTKAFAAVGAAVVVGKIKEFAVASVKAFSESEDLIAQTNAVLKSTGQIAGITAEQVTKLATAWQKQSKFSDEAVRNAENLLLTFTKISADKFPQATEAVINMASAMHEDLQTASIQVGKALQDPILGITALRRVGVNFNDAQKEVVKNLVETGHQAEAQAVILKELQTEFGGSAVAAGSTFSGAIEKLKNRFNDLQEVIGSKIVASLELMAKYIPEIADFINTTLSPAIKQLEQSLAGAGEALANLNREHPLLLKGLQDIAVVVGVVLIKIFEAIISVVDNIVNLFTTFVNVINILANAFRAFGNAAIGVANSLYSPFRYAFNAIANAWNSTVGKLSFHAPSWVPGVGGKGFDVPDIPMLAEGGIVTKPTLAMIGEAGAEAVIPLSKGGASGIGSTFNLTVNVGVYAGTEMEKRRVAQELMGAYHDALSMGTR